MKKYLLLLVFAISTATCFALPSRPVASVQKASEELPSDDEIAYVLSKLQQVYEMSQDFYIDREDLIETSGDLYIRVAFADEIGDFDRLAAEAKELLEHYYPYMEYIGGITTFDEYVRIPMIATELNHMIDMLRYDFDAHIAMYQEKFVPFKTDYGICLSEFKDCEAVIRELFLNNDGNYVSDGFSSAIDEIAEKFDKLFSEAERIMCDGSYMDMYYFADLIKHLAIVREGVSCLKKIAAVTYDEQEIYNGVFEDVKSDCPDVFYYYEEEFSRIENEFKDAFQANGGIKEIIYDNSDTETYIATVQELIKDIENVAMMASDAQARYDQCMAELNDTRDVLDEAWAAVMSECPDVYKNYQLTFDGFGSELDDLTRGLSSAFQSQEATDSFMNSLSDLSKRIEEAVAKARAEQSGSTGVAGVEAVGNDDAEYFDLTGAKVTNPRPGTIVIKVDANGKTTKVVVR